MSDADSGSVPPKDRHEPRGRKPNDHLPPSRAREVQRAFRLRRAEHLASLEERILILENENTQLRALLQLPDAERPRIGSGPTGRGKSLKEGGVPMSERVRARKEARARERAARGLPDVDSSEHSDRGERDTETLSPSTGAAATHSALPPLFGQPPNNGVGSSSAQDQHHPFNYNLSLPFNLGVSPSPDTFPDFTSGSLDTSQLFKADPQHNSGNPPNASSGSGNPADTATPFSAMFSMFDNPAPPQQQHVQQPPDRRSPLSPPLTGGPPTSSSNGGGGGGGVPSQPDLLTRLKACCHLSDSHVVNDPGLLIFATRLCQSFPCAFSGVHPEASVTSDADHLLLDDAWRALKAQLDPGGETDGENRINTGRMAAELVVRAAHSRGSAGWILCRYREGMSVRRSLVAGLVQGLGGKFD